MLLERDELLDSLQDHLAAAARGSGSMVLVAGEAGAGKSALVHAFTAALGDHTLVVEGACDPLTTPRPLGPLYDFAADPDSGLAGLAAEGRAAVDMFGEVLDRLKKSIRPIVMVIEDLHWADDGTLDFLRFVGRRVADTKGLVVCTYREDEVGAEHPLRPVLGQLIPLASTTRLAVPPLSQDAVTELSRDRTVDPVRLYELSGGNAFFVTEVLAAGSSLPRTVQDAVLSRVARLDLNSRKAVEAVAIAPRSLEIEKIAALAGAAPESIDAAVGSGVLLGDGISLRFRHELARAAIEDALPPARRLQMHRRMIGLLEEDERRDPARLAHHAIKAESPGLIVEYAPEAGSDAVGRGARREAISFFRAALRYPEELGDDQAAALRVGLATELRLIDEPEDSLEELASAIDFYRKTEADEALANALGLLQASLWNLKRFDEGWRAIDEALSLVRPLGSTVTLAMTHYRLAHHHMLARHAPPAFENIAQAGAIAEEIGNTETQWLALMMTGCIHIVAGDAAEGVRLLEQAVADAEAMGNHRFLSIGLGMLGSGGGEARLYGAAIPALERDVAHGLAHDEDYQVAYSRSWLARIAFEQGRWEETVGYADLVHRTTQQPTGIAEITARSALGRVRVRRGDPGGTQVLDEMCDMGRDHELQHVWNAICGKAEHLWLQGRASQAVVFLEPAFRRAMDTDSEWARGEIGFWMWKAGALPGAPEGAAEPFALHMSGDWRAAAHAWSGIGCPYEVAMALSDGDGGAMLEAVAIFDELGARPAADLVRSRLRESGVESIPRGPTERTRSNPAGLTARQLEVLRLVSDGMTNPEIADRLYLSKKTVEHHVSAIYSKLGVASRPKAIAAASELLSTLR
jgi:DNA-binding CsgD family transcriptional regulator/tetratricopeptide (TPR) repeat protein